MLLSPPLFPANRTLPGDRKPMQRAPFFARRFALVCLLAAICAISSGCTRFGGSSLIDWWQNGMKVGPNYGRPAAAVADNWIEAENKKVRLDRPQDVYWWTVMDDPALNKLIQLAYDQNLTLQIAGMRVLEARAIRAVAIGFLFPQRQTLSSQYLSVLQSKNQGLALPLVVNDFLPRNWQNWNGGFNLSWELDVWGRLRRNLEAANAELEMSVEDYDAVLVGLLSEVATSYVEIRTYQQRLVYAHQNVVSQEGSLKLAQVRFEAGETDKLDVTQAESNLGVTRASIPQLEIGARQSANALCVLLGIPPQKLDELVPPLKTPIPTVPSIVSVGLPADLIRRRPDIRAVERAAAIASARIGVVASELYPSFSIDGTIGISARNFDRLFKPRSSAGLLNPSFRWNILNYGRIMNEIASQDSIFQQRAIEYQERILVANKEVEDALISFLKTQQQVEYLNSSAAAFKESVRLATLKYKAGEIDFNSVFLLQSDLTKEEDKLAQSQGAVVTSLIGIYRALGTGWQIRLGAQAPETANPIVPPEPLPAPPVPDPEQGMQLPVAADLAADKVERSPVLDRIMKNQHPSQRTPRVVEKDPANDPERKSSRNQVQLLGLNQP